jgi:hypothetical protein
VSLAYCLCHPRHRLLIQLTLWIWVFFWSWQCSTGPEIISPSLPCSEETPSDIFLSQINPVYTVTQYFFTIHFNIILLYMSRLPKSCLSISGFPAESLYAFFIFSTTSICPAHLIPPQFITITILREKYNYEVHNYRVLSVHLFLSLSYAPVVIFITSS